MIQRMELRFAHTGMEIYQQQQTCTVYATVI